ncbi:MAG: single-stranded-DNA-specific exonuclease RecJ [Candidatus Obscuribacterales bacterium]|nr:single-stranded-DNA-specific exonuclease RecJ [Candidatus Obscuribacterales bacterium]
MSNPVQKFWKFPDQCQPAPELVEAALGSEILAKLLWQRGVVTAEHAQAFLNPASYVPTSPMAFVDMTKAIVRISQAIAQKEQIIVYGDYDVDGVTATSVMLSVLRQLGANVDFYIPNRATEGYGLNLKAISVLASKRRAKLLISCDCGISNFAEINLARSLGVDTIIVDHHSMPEVLPPALAILHPKQLDEEHPLFHLPGVGVAYKLAEALLLDNKLPDEVAKLHDFVTLGMIADMVPLIKENRYLVQIGLPALARSERAGIRALLDQTVRMDGTDIVGFALAPRINAVGRLSDASMAVKLMTTDDEKEAAELAKQLELENARRQELCEQIFFEADQKAKAALAAAKDRAIAIYSANWHHGVVGIVASRLVEKYHCPVFIAELDEAEGKIKGSARSVAGVDLYQALKANEHLMTKWGGHQMAAGFSAEQQSADALCKALVATCNAMLAGKPDAPILAVDLELNADVVDLSLAKTINALGPFGMWNKKTVLVLKEMIVTDLRPLGKEGKHHRINLKDRTTNSKFECVFWRSTGRIPEVGMLIDLAFHPEVNVYNNAERLQLVLNDWRPAGQEMSEPVLDFSPQAEAAVPETMAAPINNDASNSLPAAAETSKSDDTVSGAERMAVPTSAPKPAVSMNFTDLRERSDTQAVLEAAVRKLGDKLLVFAESTVKVPGVSFSDRANLAEKSHLLFWEFPSNLQLLRTILAKTQSTSIYLLGAAPIVELDANTFIKKLLGIIRFAVNQREGQAEADKIAIAMSTSKMAIALGLTILKKVNVIDWYVEEGTLFLDILGPPSESWEPLPEFRQLHNCLKEINEFRQWLSESSLEEIQLALVPNAIRMSGKSTGASSQEFDALGLSAREINNDRESMSSR